MGTVSVKYMGSKRTMLDNGLGEIILSEMKGGKRFFDLFTGSASVSWMIARELDVEVVAGDLQMYAVALAKAVIERTEPQSDFAWVGSWIQRAEHAAKEMEIWEECRKIQASLGVEPISAVAHRAREIQYSQECSLSLAYGGYYFSPLQSMWLDLLRCSLPENVEQRNIGLAALIQAASRCSASPGHTAQPFKPNETAGRYLEEAWRRDLPALLRSCVDRIAPLHSKRLGLAICEDANILANSVNEGDLVFLDPPYSGVHYSRFYHVLESIARGHVGQVSGNGRYPPFDERPNSKYSLSSQSASSLEHLLKNLCERGASVILTFPSGSASNGLSGHQVIEIAEKYFSVSEKRIDSRFSTLGGDKKHRAARKHAEELILTLRVV